MMKVTVTVSRDLVLRDFAESQRMNTLLNFLLCSVIV